MLSKTRRHSLLAIVLLASIISSAALPSFAQQSKKAAPKKIKTSAPQRRERTGTVHTRPPRTFDVLNYTLRTRFDVPNKAVIGDEVVTFKPLHADFKTLTLDAATTMQIESVTFSGTDEKLQWTRPPEKLAIAFNQMYQPADTIAVRIRYRATPNRGLFFIPPPPRAGNPNAARSAQIWTQGEPEDSHNWFPCYDFPDDKATSEQYITTAANEIAISNGTLVETINNPDTTHTFHWLMDQPHSSYLTSIVIGDYAKLDDAYKTIPLEYYTYHGTEEVARRAFARTPQMMEWFSQSLNYEYPFKRYAQTIVAYFIFGGMENVTATTHSDMEILRSDSDGSELSSENLVSHELAHSWFGNLVTCKDWSQAWLNEGFATFMEASFKEHIGGREAYMKEMRENERAYFREDTNQYRRPIVYNRYRAPIDLFDATLYKKGALILHMLRETVGDEVFWKSLNIYLNEYKYRNVETADLQRVFEQTSGQKLDWFFDQWVYKAGYPELRVNYTYNPSTKLLTLRVAQTQPPDATTPAVFRLPADIELTTASGTRTEPILITQRAQQFKFKLDNKPLNVRFDKDSKILKKLVFPQSAQTLAIAASTSR